MSAEQETSKVETLKIYGFKGSQSGFMEIPHTLEAMQEFVGGWSEHVSLTPEIDLIVNDEGVINGSEPRVAFYDYIKNKKDLEFVYLYHGDCYLCRHEGENFTSIKESDKAWIDKHLIHVHRGMKEILFNKVLLDLRDYLKKYGR